MPTTNPSDPAAASAPASMDLPPDAATSAKRGKGAYWLRLMVLAGVALTLCTPFLWMVFTSLKHPSEVDLPTWIPDVFQWKNYAQVFDMPGIDYGRYYLNSILVASWVTFLQVLTSAMAAYAFSRLEWRGRDKLFLCYLGTMMLPGLVMMIPNYNIMITLGLVDTLTGLILPASFSAFGTFLLRQFMLTIPKSLDEAAEIDGASRWKIFWEVTLPLSRPGLITLAIFTFIGNYQSFFWPLIMIKSTTNYPLPLGLLYFDSQQGQTPHLLMAAVTMSIVPMIFVFVALQKYLVKGIQLGGVKG